jgi:NADP-dependent 3-hydroxy acid dehydrogenase YdfG
VIVFDQIVEVESRYQSKRGKMMQHKTIFITDAASGIGRATAVLFHQKGWFVGAYDVDKQKLEDLKAEL